MEIYRLEQDVKLCCVTAASFLNGIQAAHQKLHALLPPAHGRSFFGLSRPEGNGGIVYKAAASQVSDEEAKKRATKPLPCVKGDTSAGILPTFTKPFQASARPFRNC